MIHETEPVLVSTVRGVYETRAVEDTDALCHDVPLRFFSRRRLRCLAAAGSQDAVEQGASATWVLEWLRPLACYQCLSFSMVWVRLWPH